MIVLCGFKDSDSFFKIPLHQLAVGFLCYSAECFMLELINVEQQLLVLKLLKDSVLVRPMKDMHEPTK